MSEFLELMEHYEKMGLEKMNEYREELQKLNLTTEALLDQAAIALAKGDLLQERLYHLAAENANLKLAQGSKSEQMSEIIIPQMIAAYQVDATEITTEINAIHSKKRKATSKKGTDVQHKRDRENREAIHAAWDSGIYTTKYSCAATECIKLNMSYTTASKALRNRPHPFLAVAKQEAASA